MQISKNILNGPKRNN